MAPTCTAGEHQPASVPVRNQGFEFSSCRRCRRDIVRSRGAWRNVPPGFRVVWRRGPPDPAVSAAQLQLNLPASGRGLALSAPARRQQRRAALAVELAMLGARCLAWKLADRVRVWLRSLRGHTAPRRAMLSLTAG